MNETQEQILARYRELYEENVGLRRRLADQEAYYKEELKRQLCTIERQNAALAECQDRELRLQTELAQLRAARPE